MKTLSVLSALGISLLGSSALHAEDVMVVYDASGSMWGQIDGVTKIEIAREAVGDLLTTWPENLNLGLVAYGHRQEGACSDIETVVPVGPVDRNAFRHVIDSINPLGRTPLSAAVQRAAEELTWRDAPATVVLISDGIENCQADPCALSAQLAEQGLAFTTHVIGFDLATDEHQHLACIAENTGGMFLPAQDAAELAAAVQQVGVAIAEADSQSPPAPDQEPEPELYEVSISGPEMVTAGSSFSISWTTPVHPRDWVTIVPIGADEGAYTVYHRVGSDHGRDIVAPAEPGLYEVRYVLDEGGVTLAHAPIEIIEAEATISAPETATAGSSFAISWSDPVNPRDWVTIVPVGAAEGSYTAFHRVDSNSGRDLVAPAEPGLYEVRYVLNEGGVTLARAAIEILGAEASISGPETVRAGDSLRASWTDPVHPRDWVTIVPAGSDDGAYTVFHRVGSSTQRDIAAPEEPGLYELRYVLNEGGITLARHIVEVVEATARLDDGASLSVAGTGALGATVIVTWTGGSDGADQRIALAREDQALFAWISAQPIDPEGALTFTLPNQPGLYEFRYLDISNQAVLSRAIIDVQ